MRLIIPDDHQAVLRQVCDLPAVAFNRLLVSVQTLPATLNRRDLVSQLSTSIPEFEFQQVETLVGALLSAEAVRWRVKDSSRKTAETIARAAGLNDAAHELQFVERVSALLEARQLSRLSKGIDLLVEHEHIFHEARVLTDLRPIFDEPNEAPVAAVLVQMLKIEYHDEDAVRSIYLALDTADLSKLRLVLDRAATKSDAIRQFVSEAGLALLEVGEE